MKKLSNPQKKEKIHFLGVGGSGMAGVAALAQAQGYIVSGCDQQVSTPYIAALKKLGITILEGHDKNHLSHVKILAVTPAVFFADTQNEELKQAKKTKQVMTWQKFLGTYLHRNREVICISGTHGKSTTTSLAALLFEAAGKEPWAMVGAIVKEWKASYRIGKTDFFITESDEFFDNFLNYNPSTLIVNNIEFDHPDYFKNYQQLLESFEKHIKSLIGPKNLIVNLDSDGVIAILKRLGGFLTETNVYGYSIKGKTWPSVTPIHAQIINQDSSGTSFAVTGSLSTINGEYAICIPGNYNVSNALGVIILAGLYNIKREFVTRQIKQFNGIQRRLEFIGKTGNGASLYDDYAHHPTAIRETISAIKQKHPNQKLCIVVEPHTFSRTKALLSLYKDCFYHADRVIIAPIFKSRDTDDFGVTGKSIADVSKHKNIEYINSFDEIKNDLLQSTDERWVIGVMGAGDSYKFSRSLFE